MGISISSSSPPLPIGEASSLQTPPLREKGFDPARGIPVASEAADLPGYAATRKEPPPSATPQPPVGRPFNPLTDSFATTTVPLGESQEGARLNVRTPGGLPTMPRQGPTLDIAPQRSNAPAQVEAVVPLIRDGSSGVEARVSLQGPGKGAQPVQYGVRARLGLGDVKLDAAITEKQSLSALGQGGRTEVDVGVTVRLGEGSVGASLARETGGSRPGSTRIDFPFTVDFGEGTKLTGTPSLSASDKGGAPGFGAAVTAEGRKGSVFVKFDQTGAGDSSFSLGGSAKF